MKIVSSQIEKFLQNPNDAIRVMLFYGPDIGLAHERAETMARKIVHDKNDPFSISMLTGSSLGENPSRLFEEMAAQSLMGGRRLVHLQHAVEGNATALGKLLDDMPPGDSFLVIEAGDLEKRSKLRSLCEGDSPVACAIPCYVEEGAARQKTIAEIFKTEGLAASRELLETLAEILPPDRMAMRSELEKIALYAADNKKSGKALTLDDVKDALNNAGAAEVDELILLVASGRSAQRAETILQHLYAEQVSPVSILRAAQRHFMRLQWARAQYDAGKSASEAVKKLQPPVFWKHSAQVTQQVQNWPASKIERALQNLYEAEASTKRTSAPDVTICAQLLLRIASSG